MSILIIFAAIGIILSLSQPALSPRQVFAVHSASKAVVATSRYGLPARLIIPSINVDANIAPVGLTLAGDMDVPVNVAESGWYKFGTQPGNIGSAVIGGHLDGVRGKPGVFIDLAKLHAGDEMQVVDTVGQKIAFVVRQTRHYSQVERPAEVFTGSDSAHLNLITCTGAWNKKIGKFSERLVVFSDKVN